MYDAYILDPDTCGYDAHTYYAFIHDPDTACIFGLRSLTLKHAFVYDVYIYDP